jgi:hypothetical protein
MSRRLGNATARLRLALVLMVGGAVALLMPSLFAAAADTPSAVVLAAVAVAAAAVVRLNSHVVASVASALAPQPRSADEVPALLAGRATDPRRHPLRPRAPGLA